MRAPAPVRSHGGRPRATARCDTAGFPARLPLLPLEPDSLCPASRPFGAPSAIHREGTGGFASVLRHVPPRHNAALVTQRDIAMRKFPRRGIICGVTDAAVCGDGEHLLDGSSGLVP